MSHTLGDSVVSTGLLRIGSHVGCHKPSHVPDRVRPCRKAGEASLSIANISPFVYLIPAPCF